MIPLEEPLTEDAAMEELLSIAILEGWQIRKIQDNEDPPEDIGRNMVFGLAEKHLQKLRAAGYRLEGEGAYELIAPPTSSLIDTFQTPELQSNIFDDAAEA